jgi:uncharacterized repeat protein (TIGR02543 family)
LTSLAAIGYTANITLYAKWTANTYTITYRDIGGGTFSGTYGSGTPTTHTYGTTTTLVNPSKTGYGFGDWFANSSGTGSALTSLSATGYTANITLYAKWNKSWGTTLASRLTWLQSYAVTGEEYLLEVSADESINPFNLSYSGKNNITIILRSTGSLRTIDLSSIGSMFTVGNGVTLILDNNITLKGRSGNNTSLVTINSGGTLVMNTGSIITGNSGSGVSVSGTFTMKNGTISGNTSRGVTLGYNGTFTMENGTISSNTNGGVAVSDNSTFTMYGGDISNNTTSTTLYGGGVYAGGTFTMYGGRISGNTAEAAGGGVHMVNGHTFTMYGGEISGNTAGAGGGVFVNSGTFRIVTGTIYGSNESNTSLRNRATTSNSSGAALNNSPDGTSQRGTFSGTTWVFSGNLSTTNNTIKVVNGVLQ